MNFDFELTGTTSLLMHSDNVEDADTLKLWRKDPKNKSIRVPGDDRSPPWTWQTYLYSDDKHLVCPSANIMVAIRFAATKIPMKGVETFKKTSQSGIFAGSINCDLTVKKKHIAIGDIHALKDESFAKQAEIVKTLGFDLFVKRAAIGSKKNVRVRAKLDDWSIKGSLLVTDPAITPEILELMFQLAGKYAGLMDWRPSSPKSPGPYGMFESKLTRTA